MPSDQFIDSVPLIAELIVPVEAPAWLQDLHHAITIEVDKVRLPDGDPVSWTSRIRWVQHGQCRPVPLEQRTKLSPAIPYPAFENHRGADTRVQIDRVERWRAIA